MALINTQTHRLWSYCEFSNLNSDLSKANPPSFLREFSHISRYGFLLAGFILSFLASQETKAQATYTSAGSTAWNNTGTWTIGGTADGDGDGLPDANDNVIILGSNTVNITANAACLSLQLGATPTTGGNNRGAITFNVGNITLAVGGNIQVGGAGNTNRRGNITFQAASIITAGSLTLGNSGVTPGQTNAINMTNGGTLTVGGNITVNTVTGNTWTPGAGLVQLTATNTLPTTIFTSFNNLTINGGTTTLGVGIAVGGALNVTSGILDANGFTNTVTGLVTVGGGIYQASTATQTFNGGLTISGGTFTGSSGTVTTTDVTLSSGTLTAPSGTFNVSGNWVISGGTFTPGANTVTFTKAATTQTLNSGGSAFNNISHTGAGTLQLITNPLTTSGTFTNSAGSFDANGIAHTVTNLATLSGGSYLASTATQTFNGGLTISGGTLTGSSGTVTTTDVTLSSGTLTAPSGTFNVSGNWARSGGTFTPGANTVTFTKGAATQTLNSGGSAFNNISHTGAGTLQLLTNALTTSGTFTNSAGTFDANALAHTVANLATISGGTYSASTALQTFNGGLTVSGGIYTGSTGGLTVTDVTLTSGTLTAPSGTFSVTTSFTNNGGTFTPGANTVTFSGAGAKTISGSAVTAFQNIAMSTTGSAVVNVSSNTTINGTISWTADGLIVVGSSNDLTLGSAAVVTSPTANRYIQLDGASSAASQLIRVNNNTTAAWQFLFPIGTSTGGYTPLNLSVATVTTAPTLNSTLAVKAIINSDVTGRMKRTFRMTVAGNSNATTFSGAQFSYNTGTDISSGDVQANYNTFWYQKESLGTWSALAGTAPGVSFFTGPTVAQTLANDSYYFTIGSAIAYGGNVWYSYQSGNWNDPTVWTTDGSLFPLFVNPTNAIPGAADNVVITSGRTVSMNVNSVSTTSITVTGTLDLLASTGHTFTTISGSGRIKMSATTDNFPSGTATNFADPAVGGTIEINGTGISLNQVRTFNNMVVNMTGTSDIATLLNTITLNGDLTVTNGLLRFNDNAAAVNRAFTVNGDITVATTGGIRTGTANARHEFNVYGDFTNNGTAYFTNRVAANTAAEATDGIVDFNFLSATQDQQATCNGVTRFYRIEITKGTDDTYKASISAADPTYFNLFGAANYDINEANPAANSNGTNLNALGLNYGTVELGTNVTVILNTVSNYAIYEGAKLWVNGATVSKSGGTAVVPYGTVRVSAGSLTVDLDSGLTLRVNGVILVEGGTVTVRAIRTSTAGAGAVGSYIQSGGNVYVTGGTISTSYAAFSLTYTGNVFNMSGGTLTIQNRVDLGVSSLRGAIFINSDPANISVTGGTVVMETNNTVSYRVTSRASFWNVTMRKTAGSNTTIELLGTTSGTGTAGVDELTLAAQPLVVLNDFKIEGTTAVTFLTNNNNVTVSGNFEIQTGATYTPGTNTTTIAGLGVSSVTLGTGATQTFNNLTINKSSATSEVVLIAGNATALRTTGTLTVTQGIFDYASFIVSARGAVTLASGVTVGKTASTGKLLLDATGGAQTLTSSSSAIYNMEVNITGGGSQVLTLAGGDFTVYKTLTLTSGIFNITTYKLTMSGASANITGTFSVTRMIQSSGNGSDGGLEMYVDANETLTYPIGVSGKYTPATATFASFSDDGLVTLVPVNGILQTTNLGGGADILAYYWKASHTNFSVLPKVSYQFTYATADIGGTEANYLPGKVLDAIPFTRSTDGATDDVVDASNFIVFNGTTTAGTFPGVGFTLEKANYTAGGASRFTGTVNTYYSVTGGDWSVAANWSKNATSGGTAEVPATGSVVVVQSTGGNGHRMNVFATPISVAGIQFNHDYVGSPVPTSENVPRVQFWNNNSNIVGLVSGTGMISFNGPNAPTVTGDFGDFGQNTDSYFLYWGSGGSHTLSSIPTPIPNLMLESATFTINQNITVNANLISQGDAITIPAQNIHVVENLYVGVWLGGTFQFPGTGSALTVTVDGNIDFTQDPFAAPGNRNLTVNNPGVLTLEHTLIVKGNIIHGASNTSVIDLYNGATNRPLAALEFQGTGTHTYSRTSTSVPDLYRITCNKGTDITSTFSINNPVTLNAPTNVTVKPITLTNGLLIINNTATYTLSSGGGNFDIPSTAGLQVSAGTVNMTTASTGLTLSGLLRVNGGTVTLDAGVGFDNYIEYSNTGTATLEVTSGTLTVGSQIRRSTSSTTGVLMYTQSNGTVVVGNRSAPSNTRGVFEVLNTGSQFNHSGGSLTLVRGNGSSSVPSLWLEPASSTITSGSTITIGNASTPSGNIGIQSTATLNNLAISGLAASTPVVKVYVSPLTVGGSITVAASNTLDAQGLDINVGGDFTINGTYTSGNNITSFTTTSTATISGTTPTLSFYSFTKTGAGTLTLGKDITINRDLKLSAGTLASVSFAINLKRHAEIDATHTSTSGSGLIFNGTAQQQLSRSASGTGALGIVTINNSTGVIIPDGNGYDFSISNNLRLQSGVFDVGGSLLSLGTSTLITPVSTFSVTNMIQTNSSFTDKGIKKQFPTGYTTNFTFPVGQLTYTPVTFDFSTPGNTTGSSGSPTITVRPANERHPSVVDDNGAGGQVELPDAATFNDLNNTLQYYWIINADNVATSFKSTMTLQYVQSLVSFVAPYTEADYLAARILSDLNPTILVNKFTTADVNETSNTVTFAFTGVTDAGISGDYFAGVDVAIPDNVPIYTTTSSGNVNAAIYTPVVPGGGSPTGAKVIVQTGHNLTFNVSSVSLYETQINAGAKITIPSGSIGHRLGDLSGTGDLEIDSNTGSAVLPAATYDTFFSCAGGGLIFGGSGGYEILGGITTLKNLTLVGSGNIILATNDVTICNALTVSITGSGSMSNTNNRLITIHNDLLLNSGNYYNAVGTLSITRDFVQTLGLFDGGTGGAKVIGRNLTVNGGNFTSGSGTGTIQVNGNMTVAGGATFTGGSSSATGVRYIFQGSAAQTLTGNFTGTRFINRLDINNTSGLSFVGNVTIDRELLLTAGNIFPGSNTFLLSSNATSNPTEGRSTSFVSGKLYKLLSTAGTSFTFPVGKAALWRPGSVNSVSNAGDTWDMEYFYAPATSESLVNNLTPVAPILKIATGEYWKVSDGSAPAGRTAFVGLSWGVESDVSANLAEREALQVVAWNDALTRWDNYGGTSFSPGGSHTQAHGSFISSSTLGFTENIVSLGSTEVANPLPVTFLEFTGTTESGINTMKWSTASELNNDHFEIERSTDGEHFEVIGRVNGKGTFNSQSSYLIEDKDPIIGRNYYRLKQVDFDGKMAYHHKVVMLTVESSNNLLDFDIYPNPVTTGLVNLSVYKGNNEPVQLRLLDMTGRVWMTNVNPNRLIELQMPNLSPGIYLIEITQGVRRMTHRVVVKN